MTTHDPELVRVLRNIKPGDPATTTKAGRPNLNYVKEKLGRAFPRDEVLAAWAEISASTTKEPEPEPAASNDAPAGEADQIPVQGEGDKTAESQLSEVKQAGDEKPLLTQTPITNTATPQPDPVPVEGNQIKLVKTRRMTFITAG